MVEALGLVQKPEFHVDRLKIPGKNSQRESRTRAFGLLVLIQILWISWEM